MSTLLQWNARSIVANLSELEYFLSQQTVMPDIICIQETFLNKNNTVFNIDGYVMERADREVGRGGGLATFIRSGLSYVRLQNPTTLEALIVRVKFQSGDITIANCYHAPDAEWNEDAYRLLFQTFSRDAIILGDLNTYSSVFGAERTDARGMLLESLMDDHNMVTLNTGAGTYVRRTGELSHLDVAMATTNIARVANWTVLNDTWGSDHLPVKITLHDRVVVEPTALPQWAYRRANWRGFKADCKRLITQQIIDDDVITSHVRLVEAIIDAASANIPVTRPAVNPRHKPVPYWTDECTEAVKKRNQAKNKMQRTKDLIDRQEYFRQRGIAQHKIKTAAKEYWRDYCSTLDSSSKISKVWGTIRKMSGVRSHPEIPTIIEGGVTYDNNHDKAELFARTFSAVSSDDNLSDDFKARRAGFEQQLNSTRGKHDAVESSGENDHINSPFELHELQDALKKCKSNSTPGTDRISYEMLKQIPRSCQTEILRFYNSVWLQGGLPPDWKRAVITPVLKANKSTFASTSYRPIALTNTLGKVMERIVANRLRWWLEANHLFNKYQSGFRKQRSTTDHIIRLADDAHKAISTKHYTLAVMLDLEKAFDLVWHQGLLYKMEQLGLSGNIVQFTADFLANRSLQVRVGNELSRTYPLTNGTPQGSVISPLLFLVMMNDIEESTNGVKLSVFADDSAIWKSGPNLKQITKDVQSYLDRLNKFFDQWGFKLSSEKTVAIVFTRNRSCRSDDIKLTLGERTIKVEKTVRFLGIIFDREMTWAPHVEYVIARCKKRLNLMKVMAGTRWGASKSVLLIVYKALIRSVMDYGCIAYDTASDTVKAKLDVIQAKALRICCGAMVGTPTSAIQVECGQPPLALRRLRMAADYAIKIRSIPEHPTACTLDDCWRNHYGNYPAGREPFGVKVTRTLKGAHINIIPPAPTNPAPWTQSLRSTPQHLRPIRAKIRRHVTDLWQNKWDYSETGQFYRELHPMVDYKIKQQTQPRSKDVQLTRLRLGHVRLREKLHAMGLETDPNCPTCHEAEDIKHFILECPLQEELQEKLKTFCRNHKKKFSIKNVLTVEGCQDIIIDFIKTRGTFL